MVSYDGLQGILPGMEREYWSSAARRIAPYSRAYLPGRGEAVAQDAPADHRAVQLALPFDAPVTKARQHPAAGLIALMGLAFADSGFFESQRAAGVQDPAFDLLEDLVHGRDDDQK